MGWSHCEYGAVIQQDYKLLIFLQVAKSINCDIYCKGVIETASGVLTKVTPNGCDS